MKVAKNIGWILLVWGVLFFTKESFAQLTLITNVKYISNETEDYLDFTTTSTVHAMQRVFPQTKSVLIQLLHAEFMPDSEDRFVNIVKRCFLHPNVAQLSDGTIFILFKGISASQIHVSANRHRLRVRILKKSPQTAYLENCQKGIALVKAKKFRAALTHLRRALHYHPGDAAAYFWAGKARFALGDWKSARFNLEQARDAKPFSSESRRLIAFIQARQAKTAGTKSGARLVSLKPIGASSKDSVSQLAAKRVSIKIEEPAAVICESIPKKALSTEMAAGESVVKNPPIKKIEGKHLLSEDALAENTTTSGIQLILFFAILILFVSLPFLWLWNKRAKRQKARPKKEAFEKNLEAFQVRQQKLLQQFEGRKNESKMEGDSVLKKPAHKSAAAVPHQPKDIPVFAEEPLIRNHYSEDEIVKKAKRFASRGYTYDEIARKLGIGKGELQLIMNLAGEPIQMTQRTGMRLTFAEDD